MAEYSIADTWEAITDPDKTHTGNDLSALINAATPAKMFTRGIESVRSVMVTMGHPDTHPEQWSVPMHADHSPLYADGFYLVEIEEEAASTNRARRRVSRVIHARGHVNPRARRDAEIAVATVEAAKRKLARALSDWASIRTAIPEELAQRMQDRIDATD